MDRESLDFLTKKLMSIMQSEGLARVSFSDGCGNSVTITKDKHGFYKTRMTLVKENVNG